MAFASSLSRITELAISAALLCGIVALQFVADARRPKSAEALELPKVSAETARMVDAGLHLPIASLFWIDKRLSILTLSETNKRYLSDLEFINEIDPKLSAPYAFSVLVMPYLPNCSYCIGAAVEVGKKGLERAEPDWRIPFYLATIYYLNLNDKPGAAMYFDIAGRTPGAPPSIRRFSLNYGIGANEREETKKIWRAIYESAKDGDTRERAEKYLVRLDAFDLLQRAAETYRRAFGAEPKDLGELVDKKIIPEIPTDPFGFRFAIDERGVVGIKHE